MAERPVSTVLDRHGGARPLLWHTGTFRGHFFVIANLAGFVAANAFLHYLAAGRWLDLSVDSYRRAMVTPLSDMLLRPLSVFELPWMIVVVGLLIGVVVFVPIVVAVLYRLWVVWLFVAAVAVVGHAPLLAACLGAGGVMAAVTRLRSDLPFLALLAGMLTASVLYVVPYRLFAPGAGETFLLPLEELVVALPFMLAAVVGVIAGGPVLLLARLTKFRPGVVWPVLLVFVAAPVGLFYYKVGPAEMDFAAVLAPLHHDDPLFRRDPATEAPATSQPTTDYAAEARAAADRDRLRRRRDELSARCDELLAKYPRHPRGAVLLWIKATLEEARGEPTAVDLWNELAKRKRYSASVQAMIAHHRLGLAALRDRRVAKADEHLRTADTGLRRHLADRPGDAGGGLWGDVFTPAEPLPGRESCRRSLSEIGRLIWLMDVNKVSEDDDQAVRVFAEYMKRWPFEGASARELRALAGAAEKTLLADNFRLQAALAAVDRWGRAYELSEVAKELNDAGIVANYELARMALTMADDPTWQTLGLKTPREYFRLVATAPENPYGAAAGRFLRWLRHTEQLKADAAARTDHERPPQ